jgi:hypothetical protein
LHGGDLLCVFIRNLNAEFFFQSHNQFYGVQRVGTEVVYKR